MKGFVQKGIVLTILALVLVPLCIAQPSVPSDVEENVERVQNITRSLEDARWEYLSKEWKETLLKNKWIAGFDSGMRSINFIFFFLFGHNYDLSLTFLFVMLLWIFFFYIFGRILADFSTLSAPIAFAISGILVVIAGHLGIFTLLAETIFKIMFYREGVWPWIFFVVILIIYLGVLALLRQFMYWIVVELAKHSERMAKFKEKMEREVFHRRVEGIEKAFQPVEEALKR